MHEAYPGHHWHLSWLGGRPAHGPRTVFRTPYFTEGWALYPEKMMRERATSHPRPGDGARRGRLFWAARIIVDSAALRRHDVREAEAFMPTSAS